ncbi:hypothetical protein CW710_01880 [Candidatus Bathyarchaeota archaeon]|nr:MAG: hypothetical protein CW710_01880 [Candidatus Bathyarchaeota archaeon]
MCDIVKLYEKMVARKIFSWGKRRTPLDVIADILANALEPCPKTKLVYRTNINFKLFHKYAKLLIRSGLLVERDDSSYQTTRAGLRYLREYSQLLKILTGSKRPSSRGRRTPRRP